MYQPSISVPIIPRPYPQSKNSFGLFSGGKPRARPGHPVAQSSFKIIWRKSRGVWEFGGRRPGPVRSCTGNCQNQMAEIREFGSLGTPGSPGAGTGRWRPTFISGFLSGVWEFEATGASPAAARAAGHCTWPPAPRHRTGVYGVWGVCPPRKGLRPCSRGRKLGYKLVRHA